MRKAAFRINWNSIFIEKPHNSEAEAFLNQTKVFLFNRVVAIDFVNAIKII